MESRNLDSTLIGHKFLVEMDNSSFLKVLEFKNKEISSCQCLRLKDWFSRYEFEVKHIKGDHNIIADYFSQPKKKIAQLILPCGSLPLIFMARPSRSSCSSEPLYMVTIQKRNFPLMSDEMKTLEIFKPMQKPILNISNLNFQKSISPT